MTIPEIALEVRRFAGLLYSGSYDTGVAQAIAVLEACANKLDEIAGPEPEVGSPMPRNAR